MWTNANTLTLINIVLPLGLGIALLMTAFLVKQRNAAIAKLVGPSATRDLLSGIWCTMFGLANLGQLVVPDMLADEYRSTFLLGINILLLVMSGLLIVAAGTDWHTRKPPLEYRLARTITTPTNDVSVADVQAAWSGVHIPPPREPVRAWLYTFLAFVLVLIALWIGAQLALSAAAGALLAGVLVGSIVVAMLADLKANLARDAAYSQAVDKMQQDRELAVEALRRGYGFIGAHYLDWLHSGEKLLQQSLLAKLNLEADDTSTM